MSAPDPAERRYDVYQSLYRIDEYRDGAVYRTTLLSTGWFRKEDVPAISGLLCMAASDHFARTHMTIRTRKE